MTKPQVHHFDYSPCWLFPVMSVCGLRAARTVNRVATLASPPYPRAIYGSEKGIGKLTGDEAGKAAALSQIR
jgi:hypothetical protein